MDVITLALCEKIASGAVSGVAEMTVDGQTLNIECTDGTHLEMDFPTPADGASITDVEIISNGHLICTLSNGNTIDAGKVPDVLTRIESVSDIDDVELDALADGQVLSWDETSGKWTNKDTGGSVDELTQEQVENLLSIIQ
jgi:hypothetical protein